MKRLTLILLITLAAASCKDDAPSGPAKAEAPQWTAEVAELDTTGEQNVDVKAPGAADFSPWRGGQPIPAGSVVRTPPNVKAAISIPHGGRLTLNHSTSIELAEAGRLVLTSGEAVLAYPPGEKDDVTVVLPHGEVVLHGTKVALVAGEKDSSVTVTQGLVEVRQDGQSFEGRAGQEIVLRSGEAPMVTQSPDLGRRVGWSEIGERDGADALPEAPRGLGKLVGKTPGGEREHRLDLVKHHVSVKIQGNLAYTEITESFKNPVSETLEGVYRFPLPPDARISRLALKVGDRTMEGEFLETARAEQIWRDVIDSFRDPAMLKWKEGNTFELRIFPIDPHQTRQVTIGYVQRLKPSIGGYTYSYPMPVDRAGLIPAKRFEFQAELLGHDPTLPLEVLGYPAFVETGATEADKAITNVRWSEDNFVARGDLDLRFGRKDSAGLRTYTYTEKGKDPYAVFVLRPDLPAQTEIKPRDFVIVLDRSISHDGAALEAQRNLVPRMIREMDPLDRVTVVSCSDSCTAVGPADFQPARVSAADAVEAALLEIKADGGTYPVESVRVAAELFRRRTDKAREAHVIYFTDGVASIGELRPGKIADAVKRTLAPFDARMSVINVGGDSDPLVLEALASGGRGRVVELDAMLSMTGQALDVLSDHYRNVLERPRLILPPGVTADVNLPTAIASGDELVLAARFSNAVSGEIQLVGTLNGSEMTLRYPVSLAPTNTKGNSFVPGEWAAQRIAALELDPADHKGEIVNLSKTYGVLSRYTTLLALESKEMMDEFGVHKRNRTQWAGNESAEDSDGGAGDMEAEGPSEPMTRRKPAMKGKSASAPSAAPADFGMGREMSKDEAPRSASRPAESKKADMMMDSLGGDDLFLGGASSSGFAQPRRLPLPRGRRYRVPVASIDSAKPTTGWERQNVERRRTQLEADPNNRTKTMTYIRALVRADDIDGALRETRAWLAKNAMDPEARVQMAQLEARRGNLDEFYRWLIGASDAAPRGRWLQERISFAASARGDEALACAMKVALESTEKRPVASPGDVLACPMTTVVATWFGAPGPQLTAAPADDGKLSGQLTVSLKSSGGDWDIVLVEPNGRMLWWGGARKRLRVANVVANGSVEKLALPSIGSGTYSVLALPRTGQGGDVLEVEITARGSKKTIHATAPARGVFEVAEITY